MRRGCDARAGDHVMMVVVMVRMTRRAAGVDDAVDGGSNEKASV
jgi:hypothetical protein